MLNPSHTLRLYYFAAFAAMGVFLPYLPAWLEARGITGLRMGLVVAVRPAAMILSPILFGLVADTLGARGTLLRWACLGALAAIGLLSALMLAGEPVTLPSSSHAPSDVPRPAPRLRSTSA